MIRMLLVLFYTFIQAIVSRRLACFSSIDSRFLSASSNKRFMTTLQFCIILRDTVNRLQSERCAYKIYKQTVVVSSLLLKKLNEIIIILFITAIVISMLH